MSRKTPSGPMSRKRKPTHKGLLVRLLAKRRMAETNLFSSVPLEKDETGDRLGKKDAALILNEIGVFAESTTYEHVRSSNREYYLALSKIYRLTLNIDALDPADRRQIIDELEFKLRQQTGGKYKITAKQLPVHMLLRFLIKYPDDEESRRNSDKTLSRDARAILYAASMRIDPLSFSRNSKSGFAGLDAWARDYTLLKRSESEQGPRPPSLPKLRMEDASGDAIWAEGSNLAYVVFRDGKLVVLAHRSVAAPPPADAAEAAKRLKGFVLQG